jgi:hypothetical protein
MDAPLNSGTTDKPFVDLDDRPEAQELFKSLKAALPTLKELHENCAEHWVYEDGIYRFYHQSFKVFRLQTMTQEIVEKLQALAPKRQLNEWFMQIIHEGTGKTFSPEANENWLAVTRPILEAFFHAHFFLKMAVKYGHKLKEPPRILPSGWAAFLYLYNLR